MERNDTMLTRVIREALMKARDAENIDGVIDEPVTEAGEKVLCVTTMDDEVYYITIKQARFF